jgi:hypothetical protein
LALKGRLNCATGLGGFIAAIEFCVEFIGMTGRSTWVGCKPSNLAERMLYFQISHCALRADVWR